MDGDETSSESPIAKSGMPAPVSQAAELEDLQKQLVDLRAELLARADELEPQLRALPEVNRASARNLIHYMALRCHDLRTLQVTLAHHGLSSLGRSEPHVLWNLDAVLKLLRRLVRGTSTRSPRQENILTPEQGQALLDLRTDALLGPAPSGRAVRIMVTAPSEAANDYALIRGLLAAGMDCLRINCAHDGPAIWERMIAKLRQAETELGRPCRILMDLAGPRVRTGAVEAGPRVVRIQPERDELGQVTRPARIWLTAVEAPEEPRTPPDARLALPAAFLDRLSMGHLVRFEDTRSKGRSLEVTGVEGSSRWAVLAQTAYVVTGTRLVVEDAGPEGSELDCLVGPLPPVEQRLHLSNGDQLLLTRDPTPGRPGRIGENGEVLEPARIPFAPPEALDCVRVGERIWFDDGKIGGVVRSVQMGNVLVEVTSAKPGGSSLRSDRGINLPDTVLSFPPLMEADLEHLPFIARNADLVGYSFVRVARDIRTLQAKLTEVGGSDTGIVLKIETARAFEQLPTLLIEAMHSPSFGVMIARGDLAVEVGFARLAEVQEEILWLCEAAHVPVIWATQVLEQLAKTGRPSRAEVTDAAMAERAECVMLNKGPYVTDAVYALNSIVRRMETHQEKKRTTLRRLQVADSFYKANVGAE